MVKIIRKDTIGNGQILYTRARRMSQEIHAETTGWAKRLHYTVDQWPACLVYTQNGMIAYQLTDKHLTQHMCTYVTRSLKKYFLTQPGQLPTHKAEELLVAIEKLQSIKKQPGVGPQ